MKKFMLYVFTKAGNKSRYTVSEATMVKILHNSTISKDLIVTCEDSGIRAFIPAENIDMLQAKEIK